MTGRVRVLPPDAPGLPPMLPRYGGFYALGAVCEATIPTEAVPGWQGLLDRLYITGAPDAEDIDIGFYCTRLDHGDDEPHVCLPIPDDGSAPVATIVWGGE